MPAFVENGPDIPERLLQSHEEGRVVFFTGSGISMPVGLPNFKGLVDALRAQLNVGSDLALDAAYKSGQYDAFLGHLEEIHIGHRDKIRSTIAQILNVSEKTASLSRTHTSLLSLSETRSGVIRLVTTNFDRLFEHAIQKSNRSISTFKAPLLPIPKNRWDGLVYLHGLIPEQPNHAELNQLVLSSGDFGLAYLTERWASRFVSELFRTYTVCFVGYSIDDPVLRYMMDALAADRLLGENPPEVFAFGGYNADTRPISYSEWSSKHVTPILYFDEDNHKNLHETLARWSDTYRAGVNGKKMIISNHATTPPVIDDNNDYVVSRVLWALTDENAAQHFADLEPAPPIDWLAPLSEAKFSREDLPRFNLEDIDDDRPYSFSLLRRPARHIYAPWMSIVDVRFGPGALDALQFQLMRWLVRHVGSPELLRWVAKQGASLHPDFAFRIRYALRNFQAANKDESDSAPRRTDHPSFAATPTPSMISLWNLILSGHTERRFPTMELHEWLDRLKSFGSAATLRQDLRRMLSPWVDIHEPFIKPTKDKINADLISNLVAWKIRLNCSHPHHQFQAVEDREDWKALLPQLIDDITLLLNDVLDLMRVLQGATDYSDHSHIHQPSIRPHAQNNDYNDWTILIELARDSFQAISETNPDRARTVAEKWWEIRYPTFKRLALFAATANSSISIQTAMGWLLSEENWWLWSGEVRPESIRLLLDIYGKLSEPERIVLDGEIIKGPERSWYREDLEDDRWIDLRDREVWLRLSKLNSQGHSLSDNAKDKLAEISGRHPQWKLHDDDQDDFAVWFSSGHDLTSRIQSPKPLSELQSWLKSNSEVKPWEEDDWDDRCKNDFKTALEALTKNAQDGEWTPRYWARALYVWIADEFQKDSWKDASLVLLEMPRMHLIDIKDALALWLRAQAKTFEGNVPAFLTLIERLLKIPSKEENNPNDDAVSYAINNPIGRSTEALLHWWYRQQPKTGERLHSPFTMLFSEICDPSNVLLRPGRVLLAHHMVSLLMVDPEWVTSHLIPLLSWEASEQEATHTWQGFLWSPRSYEPLIEGIKSELLNTALHCDKLGRYAEQYVDLLTFLAVNSPRLFMNNELADAFEILPTTRLQVSIRSLTRMLEGVTENHKRYWFDQLLPFFQKIWPNTSSKISVELSESFAEFALASSEAFPEVFSELKGWLRPAKHLGSIVYKLSKSNFCRQFPNESLQLLGLVIGEKQQSLPDELGFCLSEIVDANPELKTDIIYLRLKDL